jgi:hypothetical protein
MTCQLKAAVTYLKFHLEGRKISPQPRPTPASRINTLSTVTTNSEDQEAIHSGVPVTGFRYRLASHPMDSTGSSGKKNKYGTASTDNSPAACRSIVQQTAGLRRASHFSLRLCSNIFRFDNYLAGCAHKMRTETRVKWPLLLPDINQNWDLSANCTKPLQNSNLMKIGSAVLVLLHADR